MPTLISKPTISDKDILSSIRKEAADLNFVAMGITTAKAGPERYSLIKYLAKGYHGDMNWMADNAYKRGSPKNLWEDAKSIIMLGMSYAPTTSPFHALKKSDSGSISAYAQGKDYHKLLKKSLKKLALSLQKELGGEFKIFVDTAPVMEKPLAQRAGIGWQGKHTNLVSKSYGSWLFLGEIFTTLDLPISVPLRDHCGSCHACLDICPTKAFPKPYQLEARRCISYLTIEHKGHIPLEFRAPIGNRIYGCDDCLAICPWNKFATTDNQSVFGQNEKLTKSRLVQLVGLDDSTFRDLFSGTAIKRTGRDRFVRNVLIAIGNSFDTNLITAVEPRLLDASPLVRAMAVWALYKLLSKAQFKKYKSKYLPIEKDINVQKEWKLLN